MKILVTGGAGFIGQPLVKRLAEKARVTVVDSLDQQVHTQPEFPQSLRSAAKCIVADVRDVETFEEELCEADVVVHLAAQTGTAQSMYELDHYIAHNVAGTAAILERLIKSDRTPRIVLASSRAVYGEGAYQSAAGLRVARRQHKDLEQGLWEPLDEGRTEVRTLPMSYGQPTEPSSVYGLTKLWQEQLVRSICEAYTMEFAILRFQNVFGPGQSINNPYTGIIGLLATRILARKEVDLFEDGQISRDFIFVEDAARAIERAVFMPQSCSTVDVGSGKSVDLATITEMISGILRISPVVKRSGSFRVGDVRHAVADMRAFNATYGALEPMDVMSGLEKYCAWLRLQPEAQSEREIRALDELSRFGLLRTSA